MPNKSSTAATIEVPTESPVQKQADPNPPNWTAIVAIVLSIFTLLKSLWTDFRTKGSQKAAAFETQYGSAVRDELRIFEKKIRTLRSFALRPAKGIAELKTEIGDVQHEWIAAADDLSTVLAEIDTAIDLIETGWKACFENFATRAETTLQSISHASVDNELKFMAKAEKAMDEYRNGVAEVRRRLQKQRDSYSNVKLRKNFRVDRQS
jgi:hypothetical protein